MVCKNGRPEQIKLHMLPEVTFHDAITVEVGPQPAALPHVLTPKKDHTQKKQQHSLRVSHNEREKTHHRDLIQEATRCLYLL